MRVSDMDGYKEIAFFHHLIIEKDGVNMKYQMIL